MAEIKILHMADIHFGRAVSGLDESLRNIRRQEVRTSFCEAINTANQTGADVVLIAGDLFDSDEADKSIISFIKGELQKIEHIPVFIAPGNHDPLGSAYKMLNDGSCKNLTVFSHDAECKTFSEKGFAVYGVGFANEVEDKSLLKGIKAEDTGLINICLIHGEISSSGEYNPISEAEIAESGMDYVALGHVHAYSGIKKAGNTFYAYSGILEGGGFDECGEKGVITGTISKQECKLNFLRMCKRCYRAIEIDVTEAETLQDIISLVKTAIADKGDLYKITLTGQRCEKIPEGVIENEVDAFYIKLKDCTRGAYNLEELSKDYGIGGIFAKNVLELMEKATDSEKADLLKAADVVFDILSE